MWNGIPHRRWQSSSPFPEKKTEQQRQPLEAPGVVRASVGCIGHPETAAARDQLYGREISAACLAAATAGVQQLPAHLIPSLSSFCAVLKPCAHTTPQSEKSVGGGDGSPYMLLQRPNIPPRPPPPTCPSLQCMQRCPAPNTHSTATHTARLRPPSSPPACPSPQ